jgi:hypothetical protein
MGISLGQHLAMALPRIYIAPRGLGFDRSSSNLKKTIRKYVRTRRSVGHEAEPFSPWLQVELKRGLAAVCHEALHTRCALRAQDQAHFASESMPTAERAARVLKPDPY